MKEILSHFIVRIDENGKEKKEPIAQHYEWETGNKLYQKHLEEYKNATEVIKLPTFIDFWDFTDENEERLDLRHFTQQINREYHDFIKQPLTKEMFIGEDAIFVGWEQNKPSILLDGSGVVYSFKKDSDSIIFNPKWISVNGTFVKTIEQALNNNVTLYLNPDKI